MLGMMMLKAGLGDLLHLLINTYPKSWSPTLKKLGDGLYSLPFHACCLFS